MTRVVIAVMLMALGAAGLKTGRYEEAPSLAVAALARDTGGQDAPSIMTLKVDGRANATPWVAARGSFLAVTWGATAAGKTDVYVVVSRDGGASFATPVRVSGGDGDARLGGEMPPRVALGPVLAGDPQTNPVQGGGARTTPMRAGGAQTIPMRAGGEPEITVAWGARKEAAAGEKPLTEIRLARSRDGGRTFRGATPLQAPGAKGDRGWHALTIDDRGTAHVVWLDHRGMATRTPGEHDHHMAGADMAQLSGLYYSRADAAWSASTGASMPSTHGVSERELVKGVCYCCKTALATGPDGRIYAAWRHVYPGNIRDIAFTMSRDGGRTFDAPGRVSLDEWQLAGCPDDGPAMAVAADGTVHIVWPTVIGGDAPEGALFYASTRDGRTFTRRQRVPTLGSPKPGHPQIALTSSGQAVVAWDEIVSGVRRAATVTLRVDAKGTATFDAPRPLATDAASAYPMLVPTANGMLAVWTSGPAATSVIAMQRLSP